VAHLSDLSLKTSYHKGRDDIAGNFYLPCMRLAAEYDRAVGYFRSSIFVIAWPALRDFVGRGGRMRILCSQVLDDDDVCALSQGYTARADQILATRLRDEVRRMLADEQLGAPTRVLAALVAQGTIDLHVAILPASVTRSTKLRLFHDKLGIFRDNAGNTVVFKGSMNETWNGLAADGNLESIDVFVSWLGARDLDRTQTESSYFSDLWSNRYPDLAVRPFPSLAADELVRAANLHWHETLDLVGPSTPVRPQTPQRDRRRLRQHQVAGLASWAANDRRGILAFATGAGKTFTALHAIRESVTQRHEIAVVVVPDRVLFQQWYTEIVAEFSDLPLNILRAGSGFSRWRDTLRLWTTPGDSFRLVLATLATASSIDFRTRLATGSHLLLVADEVHRLGSTRNRQLLDDAAFGARLGLSATPERAGDPDGTGALLSFFGGVLEPRYGLGDAVRDGVLTRYFYRPHIVTLTEFEMHDWDAVTLEIARLLSRDPSTAIHSDIRERVKRLLIKRARITKQATGKIPLASSIIASHYSAGQRWIVYCDDVAQLGKVTDQLKSVGAPAIPFHSKMRGDRKEALRWLEMMGGILVAIKCLDEGVDIPSVTHALILASSKNPREFVQRRGRVLRAAPLKSLAHIHDAIVLPPIDPAATDRPTADPIVMGELARAIEFAQHADNPACASDLQQIAILMRLNWRDLLSQGIEDAED